jgi:hypothetical protein
MGEKISGIFSSSIHAIFSLYSVQQFVLLLDGSPGYLLQVHFVLHRGAGDTTKEIPHAVRY